MVHQIGKRPTNRHRVQSLNPWPARVAGPCPCRLLLSQIQGQPTTEKETWSVLADVGFNTFLLADVDYQLPVEPAGDRPTDYARPLLVLMQCEHHVPRRRNAGLGIGVEFVELHWVDWS